MHSLITGYCLHRYRRHFAQDESGATAIEYALIACGISIAIVGALSSLGSSMMVVFYDKLNNMF